MADSKVVLEEETLTGNEIEPEEEIFESESSDDDDDENKDEVPPPRVQNLHKYEYTLALVKPHASRYVAIIEKTVQERGFTIIKKKTIKLTPEQATDFFIKRERQDPIKVPRLVCYMVSGYTHVMILARRRAIRKWQHLMGPSDPCEAKCIYPLSLRAKYGEDDQRNALYGSRNQDEAAKDIRFFFKDIIIEPSNTSMSTGGSFDNSCSSFLPDRIYLQKYVYPTLQKGLAELVRRKPLNPYQWLVQWLIENDRFSPKLKPKDLQNIPN